MVLDPIQASEFAFARPRRRNPAACEVRPLLRLSILVTVATVVVTVSINPSRVMTAGAEATRIAARV